MVAVYGGCLPVQGTTTDDLGPPSNESLARQMESQNSRGRLSSLRSHDHETRTKITNSQRLHRLATARAHRELRRYAHTLIKMKGHYDMP